MVAPRRARACSSTDETRFRPQVSEAQPVKRYQKVVGCWLLGAKSTPVSVLLVLTSPDCLGFYLMIFISLEIFSQVCIVIYFNFPFLVGE